MGTVYLRLKESADFLKSLISEKPQVGVILGSGWQGFTQEVKKVQEVRLSVIPHLLPAWAGKKSGSMVFGKVSLKFLNPPEADVAADVVCIDTRFHTYEGFTAPEVAYPVRVLGVLGIKAVFITNAAGGISRTLPVGSCMLIKDHINISGEDPTRGMEEPELGPRFVDMSLAYDPELMKLVEKVAKRLKIVVKKGVYVGVRGPTYETPSEIRMYRTLGADAVGMSTIPEVIVARQMGMRVCGISCITNKASGLSKREITHEEVLAVMERVKAKAFKLLKESIVRSAKLL